MPKLFSLRFPFLVILLLGGVLRRLFFFHAGALVFFLDARVEPADMVRDHVAGKADRRDRDHRDDGQRGGGLGGSASPLPSRFAGFSRLRPEKMLT